ncbi:MAG TPA: hypothetical protein VEJ00_13500 [Candidatus Acidoferrales bacterium]|nr:hypothetical protein [Candidatus Acidoferrales bacterium]
MKQSSVKVCPRSTRSLLAGTALVLCATLNGCIGATPLPKRTRTATGVEVKTVDLTFIHPGQTTRDEVREKLKVIDTGYVGDRYFLGRWSSSTWGGWIIAAGMCCEAAGGGGRVWKTGNLLVEFDDAGLVKRAEAFNDRKVLQELTPVAENAPLQLDPPVELRLKYWNGGTAPVAAKITLTPARLDVEELDDSSDNDQKKNGVKPGKQKKLARFSVPANNLRKVEMPYAQGDDPTLLGPRIHCAVDLRYFGGPRLKYLNLQVTLPQTVTLMSYITQVKAAAEPDAK